VASTVAGRLLLAVDLFLGGHSYRIAVMIRG